MTVQSTLTVQEAAARMWDVVTIGAGPAGALAAHQLARAGASVLLVDRAAFPRWKVCGCCLNGRALATLRSAGLGNLVARLDAVPLTNLHLGARGRHAVVSLDEVALSRAAFDAGLINAALDAGVHFLPETQAVLAGGTPGSRTVQLQPGDSAWTASTRLVVAAQGLGGRLFPAADKPVPRTESASRIGAGTVTAAAPEFYGRGSIFMACGRGGYVGLVRLEDRRLDIAAAFDPLLVRQARGLGGAAQTILDQAGFPPVPDMEQLPWRGTPTLTRRLQRVAAERLFVLGDAAGYVEPFTGEGIAWALAGAVALTPMALRAVRRWEPALARDWEERYRKVVARRQSVCRLVAAVLRRPRLVQGIVAVLGQAPLLARPLVRYLNGEPRAGKKRGDMYAETIRLVNCP